MPGGTGWSARWGAAREYVSAGDIFRDRIIKLPPVRFTPAMDDQDRQPNKRRKSRGSPTAEDRPQPSQCVADCRDPEESSGRYGCFFRTRPVIFW